MAREIALTLLITILPISELRGGIPLGISLGLDPLFTFFIAIIANALIFFPIFFALRLFYDKVLTRIPLFDRYLDNFRKRINLVCGCALAYHRGIYGDYFGLAIGHGLEERIPCRWAGCNCGWCRSALNNALNRVGDTQRPMDFSRLAELNSHDRFRNDFFCGRA